MSAVLESDEFAVKLAAFLNIPIANCTGMVISLEPTQPVRIRATYHVNAEHEDKVFELIKDTKAHAETSNK